MIAAFRRAVVKLSWDIKGLKTEIKIVSRYLIDLYTTCEKVILVHVSKLNDLQGKINILTLINWFL